MNQAATVLHRGAVGVLFFATCWGTYSVAGGTGIVLQRRWDRKMKEKEEGREVTIKDELLAPVKPDGTLDLEARALEVKRLNK